MPLPPRLTATGPFWRGIVLAVGGVIVRSLSSRPEAGADRLR